MLDELTDALGILVEDKPRLAGVIFGITILFGVLIGASYATTYGLTALNKGIELTCPTNTLYIFPFFTNLFNQANAINNIECTLNAKGYGLLLAWWAEFVGVLMAIIIAMIMIWHLGG